MRIFVYIYLRDNFVPAGILSSEGTGREARSVFAYGREYLNNSLAMAIDPILMPLSRQEYECEIGFEIFNVIRDAAPDRWGRYLLEKRFGRSLSELEYALASGPNRSGALAFGPDLSGPQNLGPLGFEPYHTIELDLSYIIQASEDMLANENAEKIEELLRYGTSVGGARPKASVTWKGSLHIAKFGTTLDLRNEPLIEFATLSLAKRIGLDVPEINLTSVLKRDVYLIKRFDRKLSEQGEDPIPFISALTACNFHESDYSAWSYRALAEAIRKLSPTPSDDLIEMFRRMVFNILLNNDDDHPRNHGFLYTGKGRWKLSPLYDVVPRDQLSNTFRLALNIGNWGKEASKRNALSAAAYFGLSDVRAKKIWREMVDAVEGGWEKQFLDAGLDKKSVGRFRASIGEKN